MVGLHLQNAQAKLELHPTISFRDAYSSGKTTPKSKEK